MLDISKNQSALLSPRKSHHTVSTVVVAARMETKGQHSSAQLNIPAGEVLTW